MNADLPSNEIRLALAKIFATAALRLSRRGALAPIVANFGPEEATSSKISPESAPDPLALSPHQSVTVHPVDRPETSETGDAFRHAFNHSNPNVRSEPEEAASVLSQP